MQKHDVTGSPHRRRNLLTGEWVLVSPNRADRPWQGEISPLQRETLPVYDPKCYLCPGNKRANGEINPRYTSTFVFTNDFPALSESSSSREGHGKNSLLVAEPERGTCRVVNFSPRHDVTLAEMSESDIREVIVAWQGEFKSLASKPHIGYVQIFENKGSMMGNSNPHPHGQIWAQERIPTEPLKELKQFRNHYVQKGRTLLTDYLRTETKEQTRLVYENSSFVVLVPFWAVWPFETIIIPKKKIGTILQFSSGQRADFANAIRTTTIKYDNLFRTSFPYSSGLHQAPTDGKRYPEWHFHMHFYPPLLRSATIKKFMVGYEMLAEPQRDITPESSAAILRDLPVTHFKTGGRI